MSVVRVNHNTNYTVMSNVHLRDMRLSLKAIGLLSKILSLPPTWDYTVEGLTAICKDGVTAVRAALAELKANGYLVVTKLMPNETKTGRIEYLYDIYEQPKQAVEKQAVENLPLEKQEVEILPIENLTQLNKDVSSIDVLSKDDIMKEELEREFERLWEAYPNKKGKQNAFKDYVKARKEGVTFDAVGIGLTAYREYCRIEKIPEQYIKHGSTWFHQRCWEDDYTINRRPTTSDSNYDFTGFVS